MREHLGKVSRHEGKNPAGGSRGQISRGARSDSHDRGGLRRRGPPSLRRDQPRDSTFCTKTWSKPFQLPSCRLLLLQKRLLISPSRWDAPTRTRHPPFGLSPPFPGAAPLVPSLEGAGPGGGKKAPLAFSVELISLLTLFCQWRFGGLQGNKA